MKGLEPSTFRVHCFHYFHSGVDYIFTVGNFPVGTPVSSLYGAPMLCVCVREVPSVFAYQSYVMTDVAFTDIQESFNLPFEQKAARLQADALTS